MPVLPCASRPPQADVLAESVRAGPGLDAKWNVGAQIG